MRPVIACLILTLWGCSAHEPPDVQTAPPEAATEVERSAGLPLADDGGLPRRSWDDCPAIAELVPEGPLYVVGDVHGDYQSFRRLLVNARVIDLDSGAKPEEAVWRGDDGTLLVLGDTSSKKKARASYDTTKVLSLLMHLQAAAEAKGGRVEVLMGNHEAEFLGNPEEEKVQRFAQDFRNLTPSLDPVKDVQLGNHPYGLFLRCRPQAATAPGGWFFAHAGDPGGGTGTYRSLDALRRDIQTQVDTNPKRSYDVPVLLDKEEDRGLAEGRIDKAVAWWGKRASTSYADNKVLFERVLTGLSTENFKVNHVMIGHKPGQVRFHLDSKEKAFRSRGEAFVAFGGAFFMADGDMAANNEGLLLRISPNGDTVHVVCSNGDAVGALLWPDPEHSETNAVSCPVMR